MAAFDFPSSPSVNQTYTANGVTWKWNGTMWMRVSGAGYLEKIEEGDSKVEVDDSGSGNVTVTTDGTERLRVTSGGSVAIGVNSPSDKLHVGGNNAFIRVDRPNGNPGLTLIYNSTNSTRADIDLTTGGDLRFATNDSTERLRIDSDGRLIAGGATASNAWTGGDDLVIGNTTSGTRTGITLVSHSGSDGGIYWSDGTGANVYRGQLAYNHASDTMAFYTSASSKLSIDTNGHMRLSSGDLRVGDNTDSNAGSLTISVGSVSSGSGGIGIFANPTNGNSFVQFGDGTSSSDQYRGYMNYRHADDSLRFGTANTDRLLIASAGGHKIVCNESWHAANLSECNTEKLALNINQTRQGQTKGIALGCVGAGSGSTGIQAYDTSDNSANTLELNPFGGNLLYGDTASDLSNDHKFIAVGAKHAFQYDGNAGTYLSVILGAANGTVDLEADARSGGYPDLRFITTNDEQLRVLAAGHIWKKNDGALWHGTSDINDFSNAGRSNYNKVSIRAGDPNDGTSPTNDNSAIKIYPAGNRGTTTGTLSGGIAWQHLDPGNGDWDTYYGAGSQMWMGAAIHDTPGQERGRFNLWMNNSTVGNSNPNNLAIEAYPNGMVRFPKVPAFYAYTVSNPNLTSSGDQVFTNTRLNNGSCYSTSNGRFTAPIDGMYLVSTSVQLYGQNSAVSMSFRINGTDFHGGANTSQPVYDERAGSHDNLIFTAVVSLSQNDYVTVWTSVGIRGMQSYFTGHLVG